MSNGELRDHTTNASNVREILVVNINSCNEPQPLLSTVIPMATIYYQKLVSMISDII